MQSIQSVDMSVNIPYWDFTIDSALVGIQYFTLSLSNSIILMYSDIYLSHTIPHNFTL